MRNGKPICVVLLLVLYCVTLTSCGGGGGGGFFFPNNPQTPAADLTGTWTVQETIDGNCQGKIYPEFDAYTATITQSGNSISFFDPTENYTYQGTISGNTVSWTAARPNESGGTTSIDFSGTVSGSGNSLTGSATWTWTNSGDTYTCNGTTDVTATRIVDIVKFNSDSIHVEQKSEGYLLIRFKNSGGFTVDVTGVPDGFEHVLYDDSGIRVVLTVDGNVQLATPYTNALGSPGASTLTVYSDYTAIEVMDADGMYDYRFYFADSGTGNLAYEAKLVENAGVWTAKFAYPDGSSVGADQNASVTYNADSSRIIGFSNPYGSGRSAIDYTTPVQYANVAGTLFYNSRLHVYFKTNGKYQVDYYSAAGVRKYGAEVELNGTAQNLYSDSDSNTTVGMLADNTLKMSEPSGLGIHEYALNLDYITAEHDSSTGELMYWMHFMDKKSGLVKDSGKLKVAAGVYTMEFASLSYSAPVAYGSNPLGTIIFYRINYNHTLLGEGNFSIYTEVNGVITSTLATITTPHP